MNNLDPGVAPVVETPDEPAIEPFADAAQPIDLDLIERDLRDVESSLARLADGTYFTDEPGAFVPDTNAPASFTPGVKT